MREQWEWESIGVLAERIESGGTPSRDVPSFWGGDISWVTPAELTELKQKYLPKTRETLTRSGLVESGAVLLPEESVLVTTRASLCLVALASEPIATNQGFKSVFFRSRVDHSFAYHLIPWWRDEFARRSSGTTFLEISSKEFRNVRLPVPSLAEQRKIAEILDAVDANIRSTERLVAKLEQVYQGVTTDLFDKTRRPDNGTPCVWCTLSEVSFFVTDGTHQPVETGAREGKAVPFLFVSCVRDGAIFWQKAGRISRREHNRISVGRDVSSDMVLYTAVGSYGHAAAVGNASEFSFQRHIACIYADRGAVEPRFLSAWLNAPEMKQYADSVAIGNAQKTVTLTALTCFPVPVPNLNEQRRIVEIVNQHRERVDSEKSKLAKLRELKQGLMEDLLTGKVRVDADEVAESL